MTMNILQPGTPVHLVGGKYKSKSGTVVRTTPCQVYVRLEGVDTPVRVNQSSVKIVSNSDEAHRPHQSLLESMPVASSPDDFVHHESESLLAYNTALHPPGTPVYLARGAYQGRYGTTVHATPCQVYVQLNGRDAQAVRVNQTSVAVVTSVRLCSSARQYTPGVQHTADRIRTQSNVFQKLRHFLGITWTLRARPQSAPQ
jgi:hypothetical protein